MREHAHTPQCDSTVKRVSNEASKHTKKRKRRDQITLAHTHNPQLSQSREREKCACIQASRQTNRERKEVNTDTHELTRTGSQTHRQTDRQTHTTVTHQMSGHGWERLDALDEQSVSQQSVHSQSHTCTLLVTTSTDDRAHPQTKTDREVGSRADKHTMSPCSMLSTMTVRSTPHCKEEGE